MFQILSFGFPILGPRRCPSRRSGRVPVFTHIRILSALMTARKTRREAMVFTTTKSGRFGGLLGIAVCMALSSPGGARAQDDGKDWPMYNHDVLGTRHNPGETAIDKSNVGRLEEKWRFPAKGSTLEIGVIHATPIVVDGYVYFGTATDPAFYKLAPDGTLRWTYRN